jgi:hypothetical protein
MLLFHWLNGRKDSLILRMEVIRRTVGAGRERHIHCSATALEPKLDRAIHVFDKIYNLFKRPAKHHLSIDGFQLSEQQTLCVDGWVVSKMIAQDTHLIACANCSPCRHGPWRNRLYHRTTLLHSKRQAEGTALSK